MTDAAEPGGAATPSADAPRTPRLQRPLGDVILRALHGLTRLEDWLLAVTVAFAAPVIVHGTSSGPDLFVPGDPVQGAVRLGAVLGALASATARRRAAVGPAPSIFASAAVGPFTGAILLVAVSGGAALGLAGLAVDAYAAACVLVMLVARFVLPPLPAVVRRLLVTPFILVAGSLFWSVVGAVFAGPLVDGGVGGLTVPGLQSLVTSPVFLFLVPFSAVYYAMLVFAPRRIADPEGSGVAWVFRYLLFLAGVVFGVGWLTAVGG